MYGALGVHSGWALWLQCNQNTAFRKLLVSSEELSWFLVWFFFFGVQRRLKEIPASSEHWGKSQTGLGTRTRLQN
jgi:hypothetical protein